MTTPFNVTDLDDPEQDWRKAWALGQDTSAIADGGHIQIARLGWSYAVRVDPMILGMDISTLAGLYWRPMPKKDPAG